MMVKNCLKCNKEFFKKYNYSKNYWSKAKFCSPRCGSLGTHNKLGKTGAKHTEEMNLAKSKRMKGENAPNWQGGRSAFKRQIVNLFEYRQWRCDVFTRDKWTCIFCGQIGGRLEADHVKAFSAIITKYQINTIEKAILCEELWDINNGRTLCRKCHINTPNYGKKAIKQTI